MTSLFDSDDKINKLVRSAFPKSVYDENKDESEKIIGTLRDLILINPSAMSVFVVDYPRISKRDVKYMLSNLDQVSNHCIECASWGD